MHWIAREVLETLASQRTDVHRIATSSGGWIERFADDVIVSADSERERTELLAGFDGWCNRTGFAAARVFVRNLVKGSDERAVPALVRGTRGASTRIVHENGLAYEVDFTLGYSVGFFCDQRHNRAYVRQSAPTRLLNCFAYTCAFSVAAAAAGAKTLSIDLSRRALDRGRRNFELNDLSLDGHRLLADDVFDALPRLARRGEQFAAIVLDPPTFSRGAKGRVFRVEKDFGKLIDLARSVASPGCQLLLSVNALGVGVCEIESIARRSIPSARFHRVPPQPDFPPGQGASTLWAILG